MNTLNHTLYFVDIESTGLDLQNDRIIQLAFLKIKDKKIEVFNDLCYTDIEINEAATAIHNITNFMLEDKYWPNETDSFIELKKGNLESNYFISHGNSLDVGMLSNEELDLKMRCIDTDKCSRHLLKDTSSYKLEDLINKYNLNEKAEIVAKKIGLNEIKAHDAQSDALWHHILFELLLEKVEGNIEKLAILTSTPMLLDKITFGKYNNKAFEEILLKDPLELVWMYNTIALDWIDLEYTLAYWLKTKDFYWQKAQQERKEII